MKTVIATLKNQIERARVDEERMSNLKHLIWEKINSSDSIDREAENEYYKADKEYQNLVEKVRNLRYSLYYALIADGRDVNDINVFAPEYSC